MDNPAAPTPWGRSPHGERGLKYGFAKQNYTMLESLSSWRAWIEIPIFWFSWSTAWCRSPHGERGLKCPATQAMPSLPRRSPHGERGLKFIAVSLLKHSNRRSPHGERGLKCRIGDLPDGIQMSLSSWRAWIEIPSRTPRAYTTSRSLSSWRAWIEISSRFPCRASRQSLSSWRAWIEIPR